MRNVIDSVITLIARNNFRLMNMNGGNNRINSVGYALEDYIKNLFANTFECNENEKLLKWNEIFSYLGNDSNPPDIMLRNGDAVEVKRLNLMIRHWLSTAVIRNRF